MENKFIMTAFGKNRPGIVAEIAEIIYANKCNLEDSNMGRLADEFTLILMLEGKGDDLAEKLSKDCKRLEREKNISVFIRPLAYQQWEPVNKNHLHSIEVEGIDQAGIVYKISRVLADAGINIETLISHKKPIPQSGTDMYSMKINIKIPETISLENIEDHLENIANDLNVDITLK